jgi:hypothetical protein
MDVCVCVCVIFKEFMSFRYKLFDGIYVFSCAVFNLSFDEYKNFLHTVIIFFSGIFNFSVFSKEFFPSECVGAYL